jgi:hypothetical protein
MPDPTTPAKGLTQPTVGSDNNTWGGLLNTDLSLIDSALGGTLALSISGDTTLTSTQAQNTGYEFAGTLSGTATITWPSFNGLAAIQNATTGGFSITCGTGSASVTILNGETVAVWSDSAGNFYRLAQIGGGSALPSGVPHVANNTALRALQAGAFATVIRDGFTTAGDGGACYYVWNGSSSATADNMSVVQPNVGNGRWIADFSITPPNVLQAGAKGDGSTDDSAAFSTAFVAAIASTGQILIPPPPGSYYRIASLVTITAPSVRGNNLTVICDPVTTICFNATTGLFKFSGAGAGGSFNSVIFHGSGANFYPYAGQAGGSGYALWFQDSARIVVDGCSLLYYTNSISANGILLDEVASAWVGMNDISSTGNGIVWENNANGIVIYNNAIGGCTGLPAGSLGTNITGNNANWIVNNYFEGNTATAVIATTEHDTNIYILNNYLNQNTVTEEILVAGNAVIAEGNQFNLTTAPNTIVVASTSQNSIVRKNVWNTSTDISGSGIAIQTGASNTVYEGNKFNGTLSGGAITDDGTSSNPGFNFVDGRVVLGTDLGGDFSVFPPGNSNIFGGAIAIGDRGDGSGAEISLNNALNNGTSHLRWDIYNVESESQLNFDLIVNHAGDSISQNAFFGSENARLGISSAAPGSSSATGTTGEITWDSNYLYVCVGTNSWKRLALTSF